MSLIKLKVYIALFDGREKVLNASESKIFPIIKIESTGFSDFDHYNLKKLTPKQIIQRLPVAIAQVKASNTSENSMKSYILCI